MADYNTVGTLFVVASALLGIIALAVLVAGAASAPKDSTQDIEKIQ